MTDTATSVPGDSASHEDWTPADWFEDTIRRWYPEPIYPDELDDVTEELADRIMATDTKGTP